MRPDEKPGTARITGAVALACLGGAAIALVFAAPANADDPADLRMEIRTSEIRLTAGGQPQALTLAIINDGPAAVTAATANVQVPLTSRGVTVAGSSVACAPVNGPSQVACGVGAMNPGQTVEVVLQLAPPGNGAIQPGENVTEAGSASVSNPAGSDPNTTNDGGPFNALLTAEGAPITEVSGTVMDGATGQPLEGATVEVSDSNGTRGRTITEPDGRFVYRADPALPLRPGRINIQASKDGYELSRTSVDSGADGRIFDVQLAVNPANAAPTQSASPSAAPSPTVSATAAAAATTKSDDDSSVSFLTVLLISLLAAAVLAGAGLWIGLRRNREQDGGGGLRLPDREGGPAPAAFPARGDLDAPTVQLRMSPLGPQFGGTRVLPGAAPATQAFPGATAPATQAFPGATAPATQAFPGATAPATQAFPVSGGGTQAMPPVSPPYGGPPPQGAFGGPVPPPAPLAPPLGGPPPPAPPAPRTVPAAQPAAPFGSPPIPPPMPPPVQQPVQQPPPGPPATFQPSSPPATFQPSSPPATFQPSTPSAYDQPTATDSVPVIPDAPGIQPAPYRQPVSPAPRPASPAPARTRTASPLTSQSDVNLPISALTPPTGLPQVSFDLPVEEAPELEPGHYRGTVSEPLTAPRPRPAGSRGRHSSGDE